MSKYMDTKLNNAPKVLSLFSGGGGLDIGFHEAGYEIVACVEIENQFCETLRKNCKKGKYLDKNTIVFCEDIKKFDASAFADSGIECVIGGPPCQPFSAAGRRAGGVLGVQSEKGMLFESYCHVISIVKPKVFIFENVYGLTGANRGNAWNEINSAFSDLGYTISSEILDAADYGVPQHRERLIIVGCLNGQFRFPLPTNGPDSPSGKKLVSIYDAIKDLQKPDDHGEEIGGLYGHLLPLVPEGLNYSFFTKEMGYPQPLFAWRSKFHDFLHKADRNEPSRTLKAQPGKFTGPFHWNNRHFTIDELKRIQSFPDSYEITGNQTQIMMQIGNSVPPRLANVLAVSVKEQLLRPSEEFTYELRPDGFKSTFRQRQREVTAKYKEIARKEIEKRFGGKKDDETNWSYHQEKYFVYSSMFEKNIMEKCPVEAFSNNFLPSFRVVTVGEEKKLDIKVMQLFCKPSFKAEIRIQGLEKYLQKIDTLCMESWLESYTQLFCAWDAIQENLINVSQFFSLIDIYGHYANRGDTVKIETVLDNSQIDKSDPIYRAIEYFGNSAHCGVFIPKAEVISSIGIEMSELNTLLNRLRSMRYDVRTSTTHPTITNEDILCTYPFPMLSVRAMFDKGQF